MFTPNKNSKILKTAPLGAYYHLVNANTSKQVKGAKRFLFTFPNVF